MKICFFTDFYLPDPNGVAENVALSAKSLEARGHTVYIAAPRHPGFKDKDEHILRLPAVKVKKNPEFRLFVPVPAKDFGKLTGMKADIFHGHAGGTLTIFGWELARIKDIPYVFTYHTLLNRYTHYVPGNVLSPKVAEVASRVYCNLTDHIIAPTSRVKKELLSYGVEKPISVIPGGIDLQRFKNRSRGYLKTKLRLPKEAKILLYVGRLGKEKNVDFLLKAFKIIQNERKDTWLVIAGDGPEKQSLESLTKKLKVTDRCVFLSVVGRDKIPLVYAGADLFVFASTTETQGLVVPEAMASGLPIVAVRDEAFEGMIVNGETGFLVDENREEFAKQVLLVLEDQGLREQLSESARKHVENHFSAENQAEALEQIYMEVIEEHRSKKRAIAYLKQKLLEVRNYVNLYERFARFKGIEK